ncbi:MAG: hypothetical protein WCK42_00130 [Myxococcaceae bacterium]
MRKSIVKLSLLVVLFSGCGSSTPGKSNNPVLQAIITDFAQIEKSCSNNPSRSAEVKTATQGQVDTVEGSCSTIELSAIRADMDCQVKSCKSGSGSGNSCSPTFLSNNCANAIKNAFEN